MACRWPAAVVLSSLVLAVTAAKLLSRPIPIAIKGGLQVDKLVLPPNVTIRSITPLPVVVQEQVTIGGAAPLAIEGPVTISEMPLWRLKELCPSQLKTRLRYGQTCLSTTKSPSAARSTSKAR